MTDRESKAGHDRDIAPNIDELILKLEANGYHFLRFEAACGSLSAGRRRMELQGSCSRGLCPFAYVAAVRFHGAEYLHHDRSAEGARCNGASVGVFYVTADNRIVVHTTLFLYVIFVEIRSGPDRRNDDADANPLRRRFPVPLSPAVRAPDPLASGGTGRASPRMTGLCAAAGAVAQAGFYLRRYLADRSSRYAGYQGQRRVPPGRSGRGTGPEVVVADAMNKVTQLGDADHLGLQVSVEPDRIRIFPRLCPHRGASLDDHACSGPPSHVPGTAGSSGLSPVCQRRKSSSSSGSAAPL